MALVTIVFFSIVPMISSLLVISGLLYDEKRNLLYSSLLAFIFAIFAYYYIPNVSEDLYYHLHTISYIRDTFSNGKIITFDLNEPITLGIKYIIALTNNYNLLQFVVGFISFFIIFYISTSLMYNENRGIKLIVFIFVLSTFNYLTVISNLFCTLALLVFCLGIYREYFLNKGDFFNIIIYVASILIHNSVIFPISIWLIFKIFKNKINLKSIFFTLTLIILLPFIMNILSNWSDNIIIKQLCDFYNGYFVNQGDFKELHTKATIVIYLLKLVPFLYAYYFIKDKNNISTGDSFILLFTISIVIMNLYTTFAIRFIPIVIIIGISVIIKFFHEEGLKFNKMLLLMMCILLSAGLFYYQYKKIDFNNFNLPNYFFLCNVFNIWRQ